MKRYLALFLSLVMILCALPLAIAEDVENPYEDDGIVIYRDADGNVIDLGGMEDHQSQMVISMPPRSMTLPSASR